MLVSVFFAFQANVAFNDIADKKSDSESNKKRPLVQNIVSGEEYKIIGIAEAGLSLGLAFAISYNVFVFILCSLGLGFIYSMPPIRLKRFGIVSTFALSMVSLLWLFAGYFAAGAENISGFPISTALFVIFFITLSFNAKDLKDIEGDRKEGIKTIPVVFGEKKARKIIGLLIIASYLLAPLYLGLDFMVFVPLSIGFALANWILIVKLEKNEKPVLYIYFIFVLIAAASFLT